MDSSPHIWIQDLRHEAQKDAMKKIMQDTYYKIYKNKPFLTCQQLMDELDGIKLSKKSQLIFITINPPEMDKKNQYLWKLYIKSFIKSYCWVGTLSWFTFEYRDYDQKTGLHVHMVITPARQRSPSSIISQLFKAQRNFLLNKESIDVKKVALTDLKTLLSYIAKHDDSQMYLVSNTANCKKDIKIILDKNRYRLSKCPENTTDILTQEMIKNMELLDKHGEDTNDEKELQE